MHRPLLLQRIVVLPTILFLFITHFAWFRTISNLPKIDAVDTVVEAVDTIVESTNGQFITDIPIRAHLYQGQTPLTYSVASFIWLFISLFYMKRRNLTDACKIFLWSKEKMAFAKYENSQIWITTLKQIKILQSMILRKTSNEINHFYQLSKQVYQCQISGRCYWPREFHILIRHNYMAVCHADQLLSQGNRDPKILNKKLPMNDSHESWRTVISPDRNLRGWSKSCHDSQSVSPMQSDEELWKLHETGTHFLSRICGLFMRVCFSPPKDRVVAYDAIEDTVAAITEFVSVGMRAMNRLLTLA